MNIKDGSYYFDNGSALIHFAYAEIKLNEPVTLNLTTENKIIMISPRAVSNCSSLQQVVLGESVLTIAEKAFVECGELQIVKYSKKEDCQNQKDSFVELENGKTLSVQYQAFKECAKLHTVVFPEIKKGATIRIEKESFLNCYELRSVILIGNGTFEISEDAFSGCDTKKLVFVCTKDSIVEQFARENGYRWVNVQ